MAKINESDRKKLKQLLGIPAVKSLWSLFASEPETLSGESEDANVTPASLKKYLEDFDYITETLLAAYLSANGFIPTQSIGDLVLLQIGDRVALGYNPVTGEHGFLVNLINGTGAPSVKGTVVSASDTTDFRFALQDDQLDAMGAVAVGGIANGERCWVWRHGSLCQVLYEDGQAATRGNLAVCSAVDGRVYDVAVPTGNPVVNLHFYEVGHPAESKIAGTNVLVLVHFHTL